MTATQVVTQDVPVTPFTELELPADMADDLQSDHAGETGAVYIYRGMLAVSRDPKVRRFAEHHLETELAHLAFFDQWLPTRHHSRLLPIWRLSGALLGALPAFFGQRAVFVTIAAVETFVEAHYQAQIDALAAYPEAAGLRDQLIAFCDDEVAHRDDAAERLTAAPGTLARIWSSLVDIGSRVGVWLARRF